MVAACSALIDGACQNGFPAVPACAINSLSMQGPYSPLPCMNEDWAARLFPVTGEPSEADMERVRARSRWPNCPCHIQCEDC